ncbi:hypothetical protein [Notoacmeibacter sp. MSK16QG-6]|uniref:hypothetical protein n=1 Tax=Notoacmeibacter sp. MSK16QG-6 TaxID=2957982 RepID=UPI0020A0D7E3|nr:hypothetical protein [Notoacmeibacter sp. MSK16QG-6]MCP1200912.1 hypothetical protein [Notoacmeibacter sp. MSK16QG-6]
MFSRQRKAKAPRRSERALLSWLGDGLLALSGTGVAAAAASLPFFVAANPDRFGPPEMQYDRVVIDLAEAGPIKEGSSSDLNQRAIIATPYDDVSVGTVIPSEAAKEFIESERKRTPFSPFRTSNAFGDWQRDRVVSGRRALAVHNGRAAIVDGGTVRMIRKGSILADGKHISSVRGKRKEVVLVFEDGSLERLQIAPDPMAGTAQATRK